MINNHNPHIPDGLIWNKDETTIIKQFTDRKSICTDPLQNKLVKCGGIQVVLLE